MTRKSAPVARAWRHVIAQGGRFFAVGLVTFAIDLGVLNLLVALGTAVVVATPIAWTIGFVGNFLLNRIWAFKGTVPWVHAGARYAVLAGFNAVTTAIAVPSLVHAGANLSLAKSAVVAVLFAFNFAASRHWVFRHRTP